MENLMVLSPEHLERQAKIDARLAALNIQPMEVVVEYLEGPDDKGRFTYFTLYLTDRKWWLTDTGVRGSIHKDKGEGITHFIDKGFTVRELDHRFKGMAT